MRRVHAIFLDLQPVTGPDVAGLGDTLIAGQIKRIEDREVRLHLRWSHIGKNQATILMHGISPLAQPILQRAVSRLAWCCEDPTIHIETPAVIAAADALFCNQSKLQRGAAVGTIRLQQTHCTALVAEGHEIFTQDADAPRQVLQILRQENRLPETPQIFAAGGSWPNPGQFLVLLRHPTLVIGAIGCAQKRYSGRHNPLPSIQEWSQSGCTRRNKGQTGRRPYS
jgi:hypothetical protein